MTKLFNNRKLLLFFIIVICILVVAKAYFAVTKTYVTDKPVPVLTIKDIPLNSWEKLSQKRIVFGHQAVGSDILDGVKELQLQNPFINLHIAEVNQIFLGSGPVFLHCGIGKCPNTFAKVNDFKNIMNKLANDNIDIALMKFCHVDIEWEYDTEAIFNNYKKNINELKNQYPQTLFVHVTVPLCSDPKGSRIVREIAKYLAFRPSIWDDNQRRQQYNSRIKEEFQDDSIFDLAKAQSIDQNGFQHYVLKGNEKILILAPQYTLGIDGLNKIGRKKIAEQFLIFLAQTAQR